MSHYPHKPRRRAGGGQIFGELMLTAGVIILLFTFYEAFWTNVKSGQLQSQADERLEEQWGSSDRINPRQQQTLGLGEAFARMYIPAFGSDFQFAIIEGTEEVDLMAGPGRYVDT